mmetsp:Transcript_5501/g.5929  ORF Transcript_5501/g.5929 Transcript_5501/m.5929 type:complete len:86 (-) Transcript_5501:110-367(-)
MNSGRDRQRRDSGSMAENQHKMKLWLKGAQLSKSLSHVCMKMCCDFDTPDLGEKEKKCIDNCTSKHRDMQYLIKKVYEDPSVNQA